MAVEFESEDAAKMFYDDYSRSLGFVMRVMSCRRSERDGRILARRFGCNKEGRCVSVRGKSGSVRKPRQSTRGGLVTSLSRRRSFLIVKIHFTVTIDSMAVEPREGTEFESEEAAKMFYDDYSRSLGFVMRDEKDKRIQELTIELRNKKRLCAAYKEQLDAFAKIVEEYSNRMSKRVESVVENLKEFEEIEFELLRSKQDAIYKPALNV
ncbi:hypothetical protein HID58_016489 [Brassica napus]|uniref:FAR1 domain-containing protein n=1 Tax=Brassica napus TaxID=3708 RepID=A0ABQ8DN23_BRANA|nr:hypothetical protein HID58_016489 [Brassica napus]